MAKQRCDPREIDMRSRRPRRDRMRLPRRPTLRAGSTCRLSCVSRALRGRSGKEDPLLVVESTVSPEATMPAVPAMGTPIPVRPARPEVHCSPRRRPLLPPPRLPPPPRPTSRLQRPSPQRAGRALACVRVRGDPHQHAGRHGQADGQVRRSTFHGVKAVEGGLLLCLCTFTGPARCEFARPGSLS